jgi:hypothetical protein
VKSDKPEGLTLNAQPDQMVDYHGKKLTIKMK